MAAMRSSACRGDEAKAKAHAQLVFTHLPRRVQADHAALAAVLQGLQDDLRPVFFSGVGDDLQARAGKLALEFRAQGGAGGHVHVNGAEGKFRRAAQVKAAGRQPGRGAGSKGGQAGGEQKAAARHGGRFRHGSERRGTGGIKEEQI